MNVKDRLRNAIKDMSDKEAIDFLDKYKDAMKKPRPKVPGNIGSLINQEGWKNPKARNTYRSKQADEKNI